MLSPALWLSRQILPEVWRSRQSLYESFPMMKKRYRKVGMLLLSPLKSTILNLYTPRLFGSGSNEIGRFSRL